jgi:hypothetical protein
MTKCPWENIQCHSWQTPTKTWDSFLECIMFHLLAIFRHDTDKALKYYITNTLRKPNQIPIHQFLVWVEQLNSYLKPYHVCTSAQAWIRLWSKCCP